MVIIIGQLASAQRAILAPEFSCSISITFYVTIAESPVDVLQRRKGGNIRRADMWKARLTGKVEPFAVPTP